jgi:hypothetical protein
MQWYYTFIASVPLLYIALILSNPIGALRIVARLKRSYRRQLIKWSGRILTKKREDKVRLLAKKKGFNKEGVEQFIKETREENRQKLGTDYADKSLGHPNFIEENF